mmetsp:Transcript_3942/g.11431  ORF Transcript_3942/g.11431 Transcript_3942/m.11431 type:complete len:231 (+) Transcript_3942:315-1007(+)
MIQYRKFYTRWKKKKNRERCYLAKAFSSPLRKASTTFLSCSEEAPVGKSLNSLLRDRLLPPRALVARCCFPIALLTLLCFSLMLGGLLVVGVGDALGLPGGVATPSQSAASSTRPDLEAAGESWKLSSLSFSSSLSKFVYVLVELLLLLLLLSSMSGVPGTKPVRTGGFCDEQEGRMGTVSLSSLGETIRGGEEPQQKLSFSMCLSHVLAFEFHMMMMNDVDDHGVRIVD